MRHYVCVGDCVSTTSMPGVCTTEGCTHEGKPLIPCSCDDEMHDEAFAKADDPQYQKADAVSSEDDEEPSDDDLMSIEEESDSESDYKSTKRPPKSGFFVAKNMNHDTIKSI